MQTQKQIDDNPPTFTMADAQRLTRESATWPIPESLGVVDSVLGREFWHWHGDTFNVHGATVLTQIHRQGQRQRAGVAARAAIAASERERLRTQGGN